MLKENTLKILLKFSKDFVIYSSNNELITKLFERGFNRVFRTLGRYWSITDPRTIDLLNQYKFIDKNGDTAPSIKYLLGMEEDDNNNNIFNSNNDWHLNYKIIHDQNGYNLINKQGKKVFNINVDSIIFDENKQLFIMKFGKYTKIGKPGNWENLTTESRDNYIKNIIRETILNQLDNTEYTEANNDNIGHITPDMNLSLYSPYEVQTNRKRSVADRRKTITESNKQTYRYRFIKTNTFRSKLSKKCHREHGYDFDFEYHCVDKDGNIVEFPRGSENIKFNRWYILEKLKPMKVGDYFEADVEF